MIFNKPFVKAKTHITMIVLPLPPYTKEIINKFKYIKSDMTKIDNEKTNILKYYNFQS